MHTDSTSGMPIEESILMKVEKNQKTSKESNSIDPDSEDQENITFLIDAISTGSIGGSDNESINRSINKEDDGMAKDVEINISLLLKKKRETHLWNRK